MKHALILAFGVMLALVGCETTPELEAEEQRALLLAQRPAIDSVPSSGLGPQEVLGGECGLFLWSKTDVSKFIFFSKALSGQATFAQGEMTAYRERSDKSGRCGRLENSFARTGRARVPA